MSTELEQQEWHILFNSKWYQKLPDKIKERVKQYPPFFLYALRSKPGVLVTIHSYEEPVQIEKPDQRDFGITLSIHPDWNDGIMYERRIWNTPPSDLIKVKLRSIARQEKTRGGMVNLPWMRRIINTKDRDDVLRGNKGLHEV